MRNAVNDGFTNIQDVDWTAFVVCACRKAVELAADDALESLVSLRDGFHPFFAVHLYTDVPVDTSFVPHFPDEEGVLEYFALDAFFPDAPFAVHSGSVKCFLPHTCFVRA